ncbi:substrate-binding domain-containing protein [Glycomyces sp. NPDC047010]|uniref:PstS family phosphate ABC transporter substrate-binding protein n=1 Tax=Glycomyces sp. NPDC047010 TaxID=3155023 RepID=UPI0033DA0C49
MARTAAAAAGVALAITTGIGAANADPSFQPVGADIVGVGSDTTQFALNDLAVSYNAAFTGGDLASWDAVNPTTGLPGDSIWVVDQDTDGVQDANNETVVRPNGSSAGINHLRLDTACDGTQDSFVDFARSSRARQASDSLCNGVAGGPQVLFLPFALDNMRYAVNRTNGAINTDFPADAVGTNAPLNLTAGQLASIYNCSVDQWSDLNAAWSTALIDAKIPQAGSGTRTAFLAAIGVTSPGACVDEVQEHDATAVDGNANAIVPFSVGRFNTQVPVDGSSVKPVQLNTSGFFLSRPLFNVVVDTTPLDGPAAGGIRTDLRNLFGDNDVDWGWICSDDAKDEIEDAGFIQLDTLDEGEEANPCGLAQ